MSERMDVVSFKKTQNGKTFAVRLGSATKNKDGDGWNLWLDAMPAAVDGQYRLSVVPPRQQGQKPPSDALDDAIEF